MNSAKDTDFLRLYFEGGVTKELLIRKSGMAWPPPPKLIYGGMVYERRSTGHPADEPRQADYYLAPLEEQIDEPAQSIPNLMVLPPILT